MKSNRFLAKHQNILICLAPFIATALPGWRFYEYFLNVLGSITPFLKEELDLSYTVSSLHFTVFAVGILLIGWVGRLPVQRLGPERVLAVGCKASSY